MACFSHFETAPLSANERIAEFLDFAIQNKFAYVNKLERPQAAFYMGNRSKFSRVRRRWSFFTNVGGSGSGLRPLFDRSDCGGNAGRRLDKAGHIA